MRYIFGFICAMVLGVAGCGEEEMEIPCEEHTDCGVALYDEPYWILADDRCTRVFCRGVCEFYSVECVKDFWNAGCRRVEFQECNPDLEEVCGDLTPIKEGQGCAPGGGNCSGYKCQGGECTCPGGLCWCWG